MLQVTKEVFKAAGGRLKVVGRAGVGVDNVDLASATDMSRATLSTPRTLQAIAYYLSRQVFHCGSTPNEPFPYCQDVEGPCQGGVPKECKGSAFWEALTVESRGSSLLG